MLNSFNVQGYITSEIKAGATPNGTPFAKFSIVNKQPKADTFFTITLYGKTVESFMRFFKKGDMVIICNAKITQFEYNGAKHYGVNASEWSFSAPADKKPNTGQEGTPPVSDDDIPF